jgi:hypothetical protein
MTDSPDPIDFEFDPQRASTITLSPEAVNWAVRICQQVPEAAQQWPTLLRAMALRGLQQWLEAGALDLALYYDPHQPPGSGISGRVGDYRLCVIVQGSVSDEVVAIPTATVDNATDFAHLYLLVDVQEEFDQVTILAGLRRDRLLAQRQALGLTSQIQEFYPIPVQCFDSTPEDVLLYLTCLNPAQLSQLEAVQVPQAPISQTLNRPWRLREPIREPINAGRWLRDQLDTVADSLAWILMPPLSPASAMTGLRSPTEQLDAILQELEPTGVTIPPRARGAYTDLQTLGLPLRLYALTWDLFEPQPPEWTLFLFLSPIPGDILPPSTRLIVRDATSTLAEQTLAPGHEGGFLYAQAIGTWDEAFTVTVELPNGATLNWPPFVFRPQE